MCYNCLNSFIAHFLRSWLFIKHLQIKSTSSSLQSLIWPIFLLQLLSVILLRLRVRSLLSLKITYKNYELLYVSLCQSGCQYLWKLDSESLVDTIEQTRLKHLNVGCCHWQMSLETDVKLGSSRTFCPAPEMVLPQSVPSKSEESISSVQFSIFHFESI